ncbi:MAG: cytochrome c3 family protein [Myxococcota bacterium]
MIELLASAGIGLAAVVLIVRSIGRQLGTRSARIAALLTSLCGALVAFGVLDARWTISQSSIDLTSVDYVRSETCASCHPDHVESWRRTYHRTMTQEPNATTILGDFDGALVTFDNVSASLSQNSDGFWMELSVRGPKPAKGLSPGRYRIDRVVGSHEMQVYLSRRDDGAFVTLPLEWNIRDRRWVSSAGNFLQPPAPGNVLEHSVPWNNNCAFCHNTRVNPGMREVAEIRVSAAARDREAVSTPTVQHDADRFETTMEELGIACEACHGPGHAHAQQNRNPIRRHLLHLNNASDPTIVHPDRLAPPASVEVCGRCHGKWLPQDHALARVLTDGDIHIPGQQPLAINYEDPLRRSARGENVRGFLWSDATPQPTSMEYQGVILSKCYTAGGMTCSACHSMHGAPADDQLRFSDDPLTENDESNEMCTQCHEQFASESAKNDHTHHAGDSRCVSCHMPFQTFGLMKAVRSHRITNPAPDKTASFGLPNACTQCHVDKGLAWATSTLRRWYPEGITKSDPGSPANERHQEVSSSWSELQQGHALTRALAAYALGRGYTTPSGRRHSHQARQPEVWRITALLDAMDDDYAAVRKMASESLRALTGGEHGFDYLESPGVRADQLSRLRQAYGPEQFPPGGNTAVKAELRERRERTPIVVRE